MAPRIQSGQYDARVVVPHETSTYIKSINNMLSQDDLFDLVLIEDNLDVRLPTDKTVSSANAPVVLIQGFLTAGEYYCWFDALKHHSQVIVSDIGTVSSLHDRACELFFQLVGGRVDYGEEHSRRCGHNRYGRTFDSPAHANWSSANPVHLVGYSFGGPTARVLQQYLHDKRFEGYPHTSADWVRSITTISSPNNGTTAAHSIGGMVIGETGKTRPMSPGWIVTKVLHAYDWVDVSWLKKHVYDPHLGHWGRQRSQATSALHSLRVLVSTLWESPLVAHHGDNAGDDLSPAGMTKWNEMLTKAFPCTYYFSFTAQSTAKPWWSNIHLPSCVSILFASAAIMGTKEYDSEEYTTMYKHVDVGSQEKLSALSKAMRANDGLVNVASQGHPGLCFSHAHWRNEHSEHLNTLVTEEKYSDGSTCIHRHALHQHIEEEGGVMRPGLWYVSDLVNHDHTSIVSMPTCSKTQSSFFRELYSTLSSLPAVEEHIAIAKKTTFAC
eukprot:CFRG8297T1